MNYDEEEAKITKEQKDLFAYSVLENPYIPFVPYREQAICMMNNADHLLLGGTAFTGKSLLLAAFAAQYLMFKDYKCLILRNTYKAVTDTGGVVDKLSNWLLDEERLGEYTCTLNENKMRFKSPMGGEIYYGHCNRPAEMGKFRGTSYSQILFDEASESHPEILDFLPRSLRSPKSLNIPRRYILASNPSLNSGVEYLKREFINEDAPYPYFHFDFHMNKYIDIEDYDRQLSSMDPLNQALMRYGDWNFVLDTGLLLTNKEFTNASLKEAAINLDELELGVIGIDMASTGKDHTSFIYMMYMNNGSVIVYDNVLIANGEEGFAEERLIEFIKAQPLVDIVVFEKEGGSSAYYSKQHFLKVLEEVQTELQFYIEFKHVSVNKFERARPLARGIRTGAVFIRRNLPNYNTLLKQIMFVTPDKQKMAEYESPDMLDSATIGFNHLNSICQIRTTDIKEE